MQIEISKEELKKAIVEFKQKAYAGGGIYRKTPYGTKRFFCRAYPWVFIDEYDGDARFAGIEILSRYDFASTKPIGIWHMIYSGRLLSKYASKEDVFGLLRKACQAMPVNLPFRGPIGEFHHKDFSKLQYHNKLLIGKGLTSATGIEDITVDDRIKLYAGIWSGGLLEENSGDIILI